MVEEGNGAISEVEDLKHDIARYMKIASDALMEKEHLLLALETFRSLVQEGSVPRYTITPGAALNSVIEEMVDPAIKRANNG